MGAGEPMKVVFAPGREMWNVQVGSDGKLVGQDSGLQLLRRLLTYWPGAWVLGQENRKCDGFELVTLAKLQNRTTETLVISLDLLSTAGLYRDLKVTDKYHHPKVVQFLWSNLSDVHDPTLRYLVATSMAKWPTFCNSHRTIRDAKELVRQHCSPSAVRKAWIEGCRLGVQVQEIPFVDAPPVAPPLVFFPAMFFFARKQPEVFEEIVLKASALTPMRVRAHLAEKFVDTEMADRWRKHGWEAVPVPPREEYFGWLQRMDVFVATAKDESYGLYYMEAMAAGALGIFPERPWVRELVGAEYPFVYRTVDEAAAMLRYGAVHPSETLEVRSKYRRWIEQKHDVADFDSEFKAQMERWWTCLNVRPEKG